MYMKNKEVSSSQVKAETAGRCIASTAMRLGADHVAPGGIDIAVDVCDPFKPRGIREPCDPSCIWGRTHWNATYAPPAISAFREEIVATNCTDGTNQTERIIRVYPRLSASILGLIEPGRHDIALATIFDRGHFPRHGIDPTKKRLCCIKPTQYLSFLDSILPALLALGA